MGWSSVVAAVAAAAGRGGSAGEAQRRRDECSNGMDAGGRRGPNHDARLSDHSARIAASACARPQAIPAKPENVHRTTAIGPSDGRESREIPMTRSFVVQDVGGSYRQGRHRAPSFPSPSCRRLLVGGNCRQDRHPADPIRTVSTWPGRGLDVQRHADGAHAAAPHPVHYAGLLPLTFSAAPTAPTRWCARRSPPIRTVSTWPARGLDVQRHAGGAHAAAPHPVHYAGLLPLTFSAAPTAPTRRRRIPSITQDCSR